MHTLAEIAGRLPVHRLVSEARLDILLHLAAALVAGGAIGIERSLHGRGAGFRTHALVGLASSLLMLLTVYQQEWFPAEGDSVRLDPQRMAQGIMTGIGFLGAGVIFKEGTNVRGLTYRLADDGRSFEYRMTVRTDDEANFTTLARDLAALPAVREFILTPAGD